MTNMRFGHRRVRGRTELLAAVLAVSVGCASMHHGRTQQVIIGSDPPGARILDGDEPLGVTPNFVKLRRHGALLRLEKDGFRSKEIRMPRSPSIRLWGDIGLGAPFLFLAPQVLAFTLGLDLLTGAAWEFPERVDVALDSVPGTSDAAPSP